jgi:hypothetical protein
MAPPFSSTNYDIINIGSAEIINRSIKAVDIALATIDISNLSASCIASLSGGGGGLTADSVNSSHIIDGSILGTDICNNTITGSNIADNTITYNKLTPFGIIRIINESLSETEFNYDLYIYNDILGDYDFLVSAIRLKKSNSFSHFYQIANKYLNMKLVVGSGGISVDSFNIHQGVESINEDGNELIFAINESTYYQNIEIGVAVVV